MPLADRLGVAEAITERPTRVPYTAGLRVQQEATALLALGSTEPHYTPSKIYGQLLARKPVLAIYHEASPVVAMLRRGSRPPSVRLITYSDAQRAGDRVGEIADALTAIVASPAFSDEDVDRHELSAFFAETLAGRLATVLDQIVRRPAA
jgi:hypothetical protein